jgi:hypothetical protein
MVESNIEIVHPGDRCSSWACRTIERARAVTPQQCSHFLVLLMPTKEELYLPRIGQPAPRLVESFKAGWQTDASTLHEAVGRACASSTPWPACSKFVGGYADEHPLPFTWIESDVSADERADWRSV